ncbi:aroma-sacti cluster domain-containing protein [Streptomyces sp. CA-111067]|uniref:aroma-sacti cluster domain-containing protein n=1 Tax=Streptomyces sp. CA-111067 TaxID=3240046 RepID=UPI003D99327A
MQGDNAREPQDWWDDSDDTDDTEAVADDPDDPGTVADPAAAPDPHATFDPAADPLDALDRAGFPVTGMGEEQRAVLAALTPAETEVLLEIKRRLDDSEPEVHAHEAGLIGGLFF